ncbi:pyridoxal 5'-phosphate synthase glutaminase subunit PdxT [Desulfuribacillus alkaliarsenatis]|uniref:Pyridoxal 5'-phosphate synthase subunit PdxT n=1 Tax=Desulfuribacillus alkaliarsenatis TaxID=766136 RepID=A0A1E5G3E6_9FIRM|nr:pyridoxal 5'-phosphate synthase glutaminase subunit PdxT [Desulfuribacillus alkaliarsenatis]OEF97602.1 glutamine amidotransferase subunit PdxT [Desulfuribacillus alkaliarsenatis]
MKTIGVLALQGAVREHMNMIEKAGAQAVAVKKVEQLADIDGLIIPGGESTTIGKLMRKYGFDVAIREFAEAKPIMGTCAGMIVLAKEIVGNEEPHLQLLDISIERNAFGRQVDSFEEYLTIPGVGEDFCSVFIRAPLVAEVKHKDIEVLATVNDRPVIVRQGNVLAMSFHPELTNDERIHRMFVNMVEE